MSKQPELLSREDLIALWQEIASAFNATLELPVNNGVSLVLKFSFKHDVGETEVMIKDLALTGSSLMGDLSTFGSSVKTTFDKALRVSFRMFLPPLFHNILKAFYKNVTPFYLGRTEYWIKSDDRELRNRLVLDKGMSGIDEFKSIFMEVKNNEFLSKTSDFLGKRDQIENLITLHLNVIKLFSET